MKDLNNPTEPEVVGSFLLGLIESFYSLNIIPQNIKIDDFDSQEWYPQSLFIDVLNSIQDKIPFSEIMLFNAGINFIKIWHNQGSGKKMFNSGREWLHYSNNESSGYNTVVRGGNKDEIGWCLLKSIDDDKGIAVFESAIPMCHDFLKGVFYGGCTMFDDLEYADITTTTEKYDKNPLFNKILLTVQYRLKNKAVNQRLDAKMNTLESGYDMNLSTEEVQTLIWRNKGLKINSEFESSYQHAIRSLLADSFTTIRLMNENLEERVKEEIKKNVLKDEYLRVQSRMAQMGEMLSMIAHQWRQPLSAISAISIDLQMQIELDTFDLANEIKDNSCQIYFTKELKEIDQLIKNLTSIIDDFRNFYNPNKKVSLTKLEEVSTKSLNIIKASIENDNIKIIEEYNSIEEIEFYNNELMQVILNILKNSQDNFKSKNIKNPYIKIVTQGRKILICDNGGGIEEDIIEKIFDPYFSTKDEKNGTGLGLYMSKTIVQEHHKGKLFAKNTDDGVCFVIEI